MVIHLAEYDPFRDEGLAYAEKARSSGVTVACRVHPGMIHYFYAMPQAVPYARRALDEIAQDLARLLRLSGV
jgi:acetyl esterase